MNNLLHPKIASVLHSFARRQRRLRLIRGVCVCFGLAGVLMGFVAWVDWMFVLPDAARWALSAGAYVAVLLVAARCVWSALRPARDPRKLAGLLEAAEPVRAQDLLSAVELAGVGADSFVCRDRLQREVADRIGALDVNRVLSGALLRPFLWGSGIVAAAIACVCVGSGPSLLLRACLPMANLSRVSRVQVAVLEPHPEEMAVPFGEPIPLLIATSGGDPRTALLEVFTKTHGRELIPIAREAGGRFSALLQIGREDVQYRVRAGDALTRKYQLHAQPRPWVLNCSKQYRFPAYAGLADRQLVEDQGDLEALEGTRVELEFESSQKLETAHLELDLGGETTRVALREIRPNGWGTSLPMKASGSYRVRLRAAQTGFENKFTPAYAIRVRPDLLPRVELDLPRGDSIAGPDARIDLRANARDDWGLAKVSQWIRINEAPWKEKVLVEKPGLNASVHVPWDLWEHGVQPGDLVAAKFVAVDLKGNQAESRTVRVAVSKERSGGSGLPALDAPREFLRLLGALKVQAGAFEKETDALCKALGRTDGGLREPLRDPAQRARKALADLEENWGRLQETLARLGENAQEAFPGAVSAGATRLFARVGTDALAPARDLLEWVLVPARGDVPLAARELQESAGRAAQWISRVSETFERLLGVAEMDRLGAAVRRIVREQPRLLASARKRGAPTGAGTPWMARQQVLIAEARAVAEGLAAVGDLHGAEIARPMNEAARQIADTRAGLEDLLQGEEPFPQAVEELAWLLSFFEGVSRKLPAWERATVQLALESAQTARAEARESGAVFGECVAALHEFEDPHRWTRELRVEFLKRRWTQGVALLQAHGDAEELREEGDAVFVGDLRAAASSLAALGQFHADPPETIPELRFFSQRFALLEAAHQLFELRSELDALAAGEQWEMRSQEKPVGTPLRWHWVRTRLLDWPQEWAHLIEPGAGTLRDAFGIVRALPNSDGFRGLTQEWSERPLRKTSAHGQEFAALSAGVSRALELLRKPLGDLRRELAEHTPALADFMADLARKAAGLKQASDELHGAPSSRSWDALKTQAQTLLDRQIRLGDQVAQVRALLRADANEQDLSSPDGRERARDADDALVLLQDPPVRAEAALRQASQAKDTMSLRQAGELAAQHQGELARRLEELAGHFAPRNADQLRQSRERLRESEKTEGTRDQLNARYAKAEQLAQLRGTPPEALLAHLEKALRENPVMQRELSQIAGGLLTGASEKLAEAREKEGAVAHALQKIAAPVPASGEGKEAAVPGDATPSPGVPGPPQSSEGPSPQSPFASALQEQSSIARAGTDAGAAVSRAGRHELRLENPLKGRQLQDLGEEIGAVSEREVSRVRQALAPGAQRNEAASAVQTAMNSFSEALSKVARAREAAPLPKLASSPEPNAGVGSPKKAGIESALSPQEQVWMARALDSLDAATRGQNPDRSSSPEAAASGQKTRPRGAQNGAVSENPSQAITRAQSAVAAAVESANAAQRRARARPGTKAGAAADAAGAVATGGGGEDRGSRSGIVLPQVGAMSAREASAGEWGRLPKQVAEGLVQGREEKVSGDYRAQIETYYRVISEKSK